MLIIFVELLDVNKKIVLKLHYHLILEGYCNMSAQPREIAEKEATSLFDRL